MRIGTVSLGRIGGIGDCLIADQSMGVCPDGSPYLGTLDSGGAATEQPCLYGSGPLAPGQVYCAAPMPTPDTSTPTSTPSFTDLPLSIPSALLPSGVKPSPTGLPIPGMQCPTGYVQSGGVCVPVAATSSTMIPGVSNTVVYAAGALLLAVAFMGAGGGGGGRRR